MENDLFGSLFPGPKTGGDDRASLVNCENSKHDKYTRATPGQFNGAIVCKLIWGGDLSRAGLKL